MSQGGTGGAGAGTGGVLQGGSGGGAEGGSAGTPAGGSGGDSEGGSGGVSEGGSGGASEGGSSGVSEGGSGGASEGGSAGTGDGGMGGASEGGSAGTFVGGNGGISEGGSAGESVGGAGGESAGGAGGEPEPIRLRGACPTETLLGGFTVDVGQFFSFVEGKVANGIVPSTIVEDLDQEGACKFGRRHNPVCNPPCSPSFACDFDGQCIPYPLAQDVGTVTVTGLNEDPIVLTPLQPGNKYSDTNVPHPVFDLGDEVRLRSTPGVFGELSLDGVGSGSLVAGEPVWNVTRDQDLSLTWDVLSGAQTGVALVLEVDQHGNTPARITCDFEDIGQGTVPLRLINALLDAGITGFPSGGLHRRTADSMEVPGGCVELLVGSSFSPSILVIDP